MKEILPFNLAERGIRMFKTERQNQIYSLLMEKGVVSVKELSEKMYISESSIRRDLAILEEKGYIKRSYGGAQIINSVETVMPFGMRTYKNVDAKRIIAKKGVELINNGDFERHINRVRRKKRKELSAQK